MKEAYQRHHLLVLGLVVDGYDRVIFLSNPLLRKIEVSLKLAFFIFFIITFEGTAQSLKPITFIQCLHFSQT